jgi:hypothetical protein
LVVVAVSNTEAELTSWSDVEAIIEDLKRDGYQVDEFKSNTSEPRPEKAFLLRVSRDD